MLGRHQRRLLLHRPPELLPRPRQRTQRRHDRPQQQPRVEGSASRAASLRGKGLQSRVSGLGLGSRAQDLGGWASEEAGRRGRGQDLAGLEEEPASGGVEGGLGVIGVGGREGRLVE
eukprot:45789-Rhodomonas_salina.1